jgi:regulatory protein
MDREVLVKAANFCAYQERTQQEVRKRLAELEVEGDEAEEMIAWLIENNYLNEERFARIFAGSKFRQKRWGRLKIRQELKMRGVSEYCLKAGMSEIDDEDYLQTLTDLLEKKAKEIKEPNPIKRKQKLLSYALSKGFESDLVFDLIGRFASN